VKSEEEQYFDGGSILGFGNATRKFEAGIGQELDAGTTEEGENVGNTSDSPDEDDGITRASDQLV
jgi:hypothetical protein